MNCVKNLNRLPAVYACDIKTNSKLYDHRLYKKKWKKNPCDMTQWFLMNSFEAPFPPRTAQHHIANGWNEQGWEPA